MQLTTLSVTSDSTSTQMVCGIVQDIPVLKKIILTGQPSITININANTNKASGIANNIAGTLELSNDINMSIEIMFENDNAVILNQ